MRSFLLIGLLMCCRVTALFSQDYHYSTRNYTGIDGLPQSQLTDIAEDRNGYLWMGTQGGGLTRFDGKEFKVYTVADGLLANELMGIHIDRSERIWAISPRGVSRFDGLHFKTFQFPDSLHANKVRRIFEVGDTIFLLSTPGVLSKIYNDSVYYWQKSFHDKKIWRLHVGPANEILFLLDDGSISLWGKTKTYAFTKLDSVGKIFGFYNWKDNIMVSAENGLFKLDPAHHHLGKLPWNTHAYVLKYDGKRNIFWTTDGSTLFKETVTDDFVNQYDTVLHDVGVNKVFIDSEENIWIGTDGRGLYRYYIQDFFKTTPEDIRGVMAILQDVDGSLWLGTMAKGLWRMKDKKFKHFYDVKIPSRNTINTIKQVANGDVWLGTRYGLGKYDKTRDVITWYTEKDGLPHHFIMALEVDDHGGLWIGTGLGICYYDGKSFNMIGDKDDLSRKFSCWSLHYAPQYQTLFVATDQNLFAVKNGKTDAFTVDKLKNVVMTSIHAFRDSLLAISTGGFGIVIIDPRNSNYTILTMRDGLASDFNYFVAEDEQGYLWVGSEKGINRLRLNKKNEIIENLHYGFDNGLLGLETNQNAFSFAAGKKYFGLVDGLYSFNERGTANIKPFNLHLVDVQILYGEYDTRNYADSLFSFFKIPYAPQLPPDKNHLTFQFNRVDKQHPNSVRYKYLLENFDKTWSLPSSVQQATYGNLPPGDYIFRVKATDIEGSWSGKEIAYPFTVQAPFYQQASFIIGLIILSAGIVTLILYLRVKQRIRKAVQVERIRAQEQETLRKEIARDFHDEMGNQLTRIINYVSLLKLNGSTNNHAELYCKVEESAKYLYNGTRDFIWAIDPVNDELSNLFIHIRDFGEKLFEEKNISFRAFNVMSDTKDKVKLPYGFSREANLIFKESMTNAFKYSQAKNVTFSLHQYEDHYEMILEDDGVGFYTGQVEKLNGLKNIRERADRINAILRISSSKDRGTKITLSFKLTKHIHHGFTV